MTNRIIPWVDPYTNEPLEEKNGFVVSKSSKYIITNGIPNFVNKVTNEEQNQVKEAFGFKWNTTDYGQNNEEFENKIKPLTMEFMGLDETDLAMFQNKTILDVGVGSGSSARLWATDSKEFHGIDISNAIYRAPQALSLSDNIILSQSDLNYLPYDDEVFEIIVSNGVLHHTPDTKKSLQAILKKLKPHGICLFYIYKKKGPLREFSDDFIRSEISDLSYDEALIKLKPITEFTKTLHDQNISITVNEDIPCLV
jgi:arsenite methyltransferase